LAQFLKKQPIIQQEERSEARGTVSVAARPLIVGPFGWPYPILNVILQILERLQLMALNIRQAGPYFTYFPRTATRRTEYIRDKEGRIIEKIEEVSID